MHKNISATSREKLIKTFHYFYITACVTNGLQNQNVFLHLKVTTSSNHYTLIQSSLSKIKLSHFYIYEIIIDMSWPLHGEYVWWGQGSE